MTVNQLLVLGGLFIAICCVLMGGLGLLNYMVDTVYAPAAPANIDLPTPLPSATAGPTLPPTQTPAPTEMPYESRIPQGWKQFTEPSAPGMEVWLPSSFVPVTQLKNVHELQFVDTSSDEEIKTVLHLADTNQGTSLIYTTFGIGTARSRNETYEQLIDRVFGKMMRVAILIENREVTIAGGDARKLVFDITSNGVNVGMTYYIARVGDTVWYFGFNTPFNDLYVRMPVFEQIMQTFRLRPVTPTPTITPTIPSPTNTPLP